MKTFPRLIFCALAFLLVLSLASFAASKAKASEASIQIVGGNTSPYYWPGTVSIQSMSNIHYGGSEGHFCTGTIVRPRWVLTAAHCVYGSHQSIGILAGQSNLDSSLVVKRRVIAKRVPWNYSPRVGTHDVAMLYLGKAVSPELVAPISFRYVYPGEDVWAVGWGIDDYGYIPNNLREVDMTVLGSCNFDDGALDKTTVCANNKRDHGAICSGDSGGPLFTPYGVLVGVSNFSGSSAKSCWDPSYPSGFARISNNARWIKHQFRNPPGYWYRR